MDQLCNLRLYPLCSTVAGSNPRPRRIDGRIRSVTRSSITSRLWGQLGVSDLARAARTAPVDEEPVSQDVESDQERTEAGGHDGHLHVVTAHGVVGAGSRVARGYSPRRALTRAIRITS